jgi:hypothetical protein
MSACFTRVNGRPDGIAWLAKLKGIYYSLSRS